MFWNNIKKRNNWNNNLKNYGLCSCHYLSKPALSWDAMHNMTKVELVLIQDPEMYLFFEKGILIFLKRYSKASNMYLKSYDPEKNENILYT